MWLRLTSFEFDGSGQIKVKMELWNRTDGQLLIWWSEEDNLELMDNLGHKYRRARDAGWTEGWDSVTSEQFDPSERRQLKAGNQSMTMAYADSAYFDPAVTDMWLTVTEMSRIEHAKWHIPVPK